MTTGKLVANRHQPVCQTLFGVPQGGTPLAAASHRPVDRPELSRRTVKERVAPEFAFGGQL